MSTPRNLIDRPQSSAFEIEYRYLLANDEWKKARHESCNIRQHYFPHLIDQSVQLKITVERNTAFVTALHPQYGELCQFLIPQEILKKFDIDNLRFLTTDQGLVPVSDTLEARIRSKNGLYEFGIKADTAMAGKRHKLAFEISDNIARILLPHCPHHVDKIHYGKVVANGLGWEINEFLGQNDGLVLAEIERPHTARDFDKPAWLGDEVTADPRYLSRNLARFPVSQGPQPA